MFTELFTLFGKLVPLPHQVKKLKEIIAIYEKNPNDKEYKQALAMVCIMIAENIATEGESVDKVLRESKEVKEWLKVMPTKS